jgi:excisionase family DNA binding protein
MGTPQAAEALGVSVSTIKRWVDDRILPAVRTAGGHRKLLRAEVIALARRGDLPRGDLAALSGIETANLAANLDRATRALLKALLDGRGSEASAIVRRLYRSGVSLESLADRVIAPALAAVGEQWEAGTTSVWEEHRATQLCAAALFDLKDDLEIRAEKNRPVAIGGAPEGDPYLLPTLLAQYVLLDAGWEAVNLGPNTPLTSLQDAMQRLRPRLVWLSVSYLSEPAAFRDAYASFYRVAEKEGVPVAVGGNALTEPFRSSVPYTTHGDGLEHLAAFARTLHPRPRRPKRGRPPMKT